MSDSSQDNYPITDQPTRDLSDLEATDDSLWIAEDLQDDEPGEIPQRIGDYSIRQLIGSGGMGQVFLAEHTRMQRVVAIKMLPVDRMKDEEAVERFYDEVRAASRLMHPNIVTAFDAGDFEGIHYLAMEYVDGVTLTRAIARNGPMPVGEAASVIRQAALGLLHAHRAGIIHRDVKPGNLMRAADGTVKILDLGLARISNVDLSGDTSGTDEGEKAKSRGKLIGTLPFMSPEQLESPDTVDPRSDIYSLGATFFFLLAGRPPFTGEYLEQVSGHRHGEIPDLMQLREDVDLKLANIFRRMMAKSPDERYASLDEVIDDLAEYTDQSGTPAWLAEFTPRAASHEASTASGGSTSAVKSRVFAIDLGMFYSAAADGSRSGPPTLLQAGSDDRALFRMAVASEGESIRFGDRAMERRSTRSQNLVHCLPMYIGKTTVEREIAGRRCPPEVLLAMMIRQITENAWSMKSLPAATAITVPASYDQLHRQSVLQAARMAGLKSVRLVDRCMAACQTLLVEVDPETEQADEHVRADDDQTILFVGLTGQASEVAVVRRETARLSQQATAGHWHTGTLRWLQRLVDLTAELFLSDHDFDPRKTAMASSLQVACERAMNSMLLMPKVRVTLEVKGESLSVNIDRDRWLAACSDLVAGVRKSIDVACKQAAILPSEIDVCMTLGPLLRITAVRQAILGGLDQEVQFYSVDRADVARGAAACLAGELPGRGGVAMPPRGITSQSLGIVVEDIRGRRRILPIIPKGTSLPARTNRRLTVGTDRDTMTLSMVESSGVESDDWHALGRHAFEVRPNAMGRVSRSRMIGFEVDLNGMLTVRAQQPGAPGSTRLPSLPAPVLAEEDIAEWMEWIADQR